MTKEETKNYRKTLLTRQMDLENESRRREMLTTEATSDDLDRIQQSTGREYAIGGLERNLNQSRQVNAALRRLDAGTFGVCGNCEEEIATKRLFAVPWAQCCIVCQEAADLDEQASPSADIEESLLMTV